MKKVLKGVSLVVVIFTIMVILPSFMDSIGLFSMHSEAEDAEWSETEVTPTPTEDVEVTPGKFLVVEIVPYKGLGEVGYLVGGEEMFDEKYFTLTDVEGDVGILNGAVSYYKAYTEQVLPASGPSYWPWKTVTNYKAQNGYFQYVGSGNGGSYGKSTNQEVYVRVADGAGTHRAVLVSENTGMYDQGDKTNKKNVKAYFVYGQPAGVSLYSTTQAYAPAFVNRTTDSKGDYDYNADTKSFYLNKGKGTYNIIFIPTSGTTNVYYMRNDYQVVDDASGDYSWEITYKLGGSNCNYNKYSTGLTFNYLTNGAYKWVQADIPADKVMTANYCQEGTPNTTSEKVWIKNQKFQINMEYNYSNSPVTIVNNEFFKRLTLGIPGEYCKNYQVEVVTMTPTQLNLAENQHYLKEANMFYINDALHNIGMVDLYEEKTDEGLALTNNQKYQRLKKSLNFTNFDLSWESTMLIFKRIAGVKADGSLGGYRAATMFDNTYVKSAIDGGASSINNLVKLYIMVYQRDAAKFYNAFVKPSTTHNTIELVENDANLTGTTGGFIRPDSTNQAAGYTASETIYWNKNTFYPYALDTSGNLVKLTGTELTKAIPNANLLAQTTDMISNVIVMNGQEIFNRFEREITFEDALEETKIYLASKNGGVVPTTFHLFSFIQVTTNEGAGYGNNQSGDTNSGGEDGTSGSNLRTYTSVLNIEPTADFSASESNIRTMLDGYNLDIVNMTCAEFNSSILDINTHFDIIYIGGATGRFNTSGSSTVYNKAEDVTAVLEDKMNGSVYHKGDRILTSEGAKNYTANDITAQKKVELEDFMGAGYAVVLENNVYTLSGAVHSSTNLYQFIQAKKVAGAANLFNYNDFTTSKITFLGKLGSCVEITRPMIRMVEPVLAVGAEFNYIYVNPMTNLLTISFQLLPKNVYEDYSINYNAYLYMDYNEDGIFAESEKLNAVPKDGSVLPVGITESRTTAYTYDYDMSKYNGVYQWQVKVVRQAKDATGLYQDTLVRSEITGYATCTKKQDINILQITDNATDLTAYSLEGNAYDSTSLIEEYGGFGVNKLKDYNLIFETMSVEDFLALYDEPYTVTPPEIEEATNKLSLYHMIILDNQVDIITNDKGALTNIQNEIANGLGVIFTKGAINFNNQSTYLSSPLFGNQKTYPKLSQIATPSAEDPYYIFDFNISGYSSIMNLISTYNTAFITKANEGADSQYPYKIGSAIKIAESSYVEDTTIDYNRSDSIPLIGWYCLSDSRSPVVRSKGLVPDTAANTYTGIYSSSPNDSKNNYYLFNRGKIYYSGIQLHLADTLGNDDEIKLFINTIVAAYKTTGRVIAKAPTITITQPVPVSNVINLTTTDFTGKTEIPIYFRIADSSSDINLVIDWIKSSGATSTWDKKIYSVSDSGVMTEVMDTANVSNGNYAVLIPVSNFDPSNLLKITATNKQGKTTVLNTTINYSATSVSITIDNAGLVKNDIYGEQYLYIDIDYATVDDEEEYLDQSVPIILDFTVFNASENVSINVTDVAGPFISVLGNQIYRKGEDTPAYNLNEKVVPNGSYYIKLPATIMYNKSSREIKITAKINDTVSGANSANVILLRRSLFQLD